MTKIQEAVKTVQDLSNEYQLPECFVNAVLLMKIGTLMQSQYQLEDAHYKIKEDGSLYECFCNFEIKVDSPNHYEILGDWKIYIPKAP